MRNLNQILQKDVDYYVDEQGFWVFTKKFLESRGYCCKSGCRHCPYDFKFSGPHSLDLEPDDASIRNKDF